MDLKILVGINVALIVIILVMAAGLATPHSPKGYHCQNDPSPTGNPSGYTCIYTY